MIEQVSPDYLRSAEASGLLATLDGLPYVVGEHLDAVTGQRQCLAEYVDPGLLADPSALRRLRQALATTAPAAERTVLRVPPDLSPGPPWTPHLTYIRFTGKAGPVPPHVLPAETRHEPALVGWLAAAFDLAGREQGHDAGARSAELATQLLAAPDRRSYVATAGGIAVGHVTLLCAAQDEVTGRDFVELLDSLVEPDQDVSGLTADLVAAAAAHAEAEGLPLIGHVVHPVGAAASRAEAVLASLLRRGWVLDHRYYSAPPLEGA
ncbi:hypothetical protein [Crossiella cryophila]|uniref:N-acetyltransferase domain-containing protein n=1 Tax=Crossiella cryophila TaxID=43355 RepID=A0A7W7CCU8_9PSEU|nr:hypothetical protein [Crossiella cryophila]MBB4678778.1 hypothetical protein [Crossiella cryophila]